MRVARLGICSALFIFGVTAFSQSTAPTAALLARTFMIQVGHERGSAFAIDVDGGEYWLTAKHLFTGAKHLPAGSYISKSAFVYVLSQGTQEVNPVDQHWNREYFTVIDPGEDIDILVLVPLVPIVPKAAPLNTENAEIELGGDCEFLGFPYGAGYKALFGSTWVWEPFVKHCTISGFEQIHGETTVAILDGINNMGFSGGPVFVGSGASETIFAVVSGYETEPLRVVPAKHQDADPQVVPPPPDQIVNANNGFIVAFGIQPAINAIRRDPIGPPIHPR